MALIARKAQGSVPDRLRRFVAENLGALEPGLRVLETSLRLGRSCVDVVAVDGKQTLVLVAVAEVADVAMLVSALDAYIWCVAFPDNVRRLYPDAAIAAARPPRIVFVAAQMPGAFLELVERLSVVNPECHELNPDASAEDADPPVAVAQPVVAATAEPPAPEPVAVVAAARLNAGFDAAVARQWESFLSDHAVAAPAAAVEAPVPVAASTPTWPPRAESGRAVNSAPANAQASNGHVVRTPASSAPAANGHTLNGHGADGHAASRPTIAGEPEAPISRSALANGHAASGHANAHAANGAVAGGKVARRQAPLAQAAEALLAQAVRTAESSHVEHAAVNLGVRPRAEAAPAAAPIAPASRAAAEPKPTAESKPAAEAKPAAPRAGHEETRTVNHPALQALRFPKSGVSRQWQEFLDQLAANQ